MTLPSHHWQGIVTTYVGPTNFRPSRIRAKSWFCSKLYSWDHALGEYENHLAAARKLTYDMGLGRPSVAGGPEWDIVGANSSNATGYIFILFDKEPS